MDANPNPAIVTLMRLRGVGQDHLSAIVGIAQPNISRHLRGQRSWKIDYLSAIASDFGVPIGLLFETVPTVLHHVADFIEINNREPWTDDVAEPRLFPIRSVA